MKFTNKEAYLQDKLRDAWQRGRSAEDTANALRLMKAYVELRFDQFTNGKKKKIVK